MRTLEEIVVCLKEQELELKKQYHVRSIAIFGSFVRGQQTEKSDLDFLVEFSGPVSLLHIISLENHLSDLLGFPVDVVLKRNIRKELRRAILEEAIPL